MDAPQSTSKHHLTTLTMGWVTKRIDIEDLGLSETKIKQCSISLHRGKSREAKKRTITKSLCRIQILSLPWVRSMMPIPTDVQGMPYGVNIKGTVFFIYVFFY